MRSSTGKTQKSSAKNSIAANCKTRRATRRKNAVNRFLSLYESTSQSPQSASRIYVNPIYKDTITSLKIASETDGQYAEADLVLLAGGGNTPHYHKKFTEKFTAIDGTLGLQLADERLLLNLGESYNVLIGMVHHFFNLGDDQIRFRIRVTPGRAGFENTIRIGYGLARDGRTNGKGVSKSIAALALLFYMSETHVPGLLTLLSQLLRLAPPKRTGKATDRHILPIVNRRQNALTTTFV